MITQTIEPQVFVVTDAERGLRLDRFLGRRIPRMSRSSVQEAIASRVSLSSGAQPKPARQVFPGEVVTVTPRAVPPHVLERASPEVLHESEGWMVVDKPANLASTPSAARPGDDLATLTGLHPAHRLDRFTSGCLVLTWTPEAARHFERVFREQLALKEYLAAIRGVPAAASFEVSAPVTSDRDSRAPTKMRVAREGETGDDVLSARTEFAVLHALGEECLVLARPATGRRHQIRVHLAHAGHPIVGDLLYGGDERDFVRFQLGQPIVVRDGLEPGRHLLHARAITVPDLDGRLVRVEAPLPADMAEWAASVEAHHAAAEPRG